MKQLIEFPLEEGGTVLIEVDDHGSEGVVRAARPGEIAERATQTFENALGNISGITAAIMNKLRGLSTPPEQIGVEFGIKLNAKAGAFIAWAESEANFKVTLTWKKDTKTSV